MIAPLAPMLGTLEPVSIAHCVRSAAKPQAR